MRVADDVMAAFALLRWPGNVRQLANVVRTAVALLEDGEDTLTLAQLGDGGAGRHRPAGLAARHECGDWRELADARIREMLVAVEGNVSEAARRLRISRNTVYRHIS